MRNELKCLFLKKVYLMRILSLGFSLVIVLIGCLPSENARNKEVIFHASHEPKKQTAPFSDVVQVGDLYFLSGQIGMNHKTRTLVTGGIQAETKQTLENIKAVLAQHNLAMKDVVKATVILDTISDFGAFNEIYQGYFSQKPARTTFAAEGLARGAKIEIEVVAVKASH